jgi:TPP-dependent pyruvate/acetoin dehydrogenase alpha subunit
MPRMTEAPSEADPPRDRLLAFYRQMATIRAFEGQVQTLASNGLVPGLTHLSSGQEAVAVGVCGALAPADLIASNHRGHGHCLAKGAAPDRLMTEILGRVGGYGMGRSGTLHIADPAHGNLGTNGIVGGGVTLAAGAALSAKVRRSGQVAVAFFGDGAMNQGVVFEVMNMAAIWALPLVLVCENNGYGEFTATDAVTAGRSLTDRGAVFAIPSVDVDGMDVRAVYRAAASAVARARAGPGPSFLNCATWRFSGHHVGDHQDYKDDAEAQAWRAKDPLPRLARELTEAGLATEAELAAFDAAAKATVDDAVKAARRAAEPDAAVLGDFLYA